MCAAAVVGDEAGFGVDLADLGVPEIDEVDEALRAPVDVGSARGILWVGGAGEIEAGGGTEVFGAVDAVAVA